MDSLCHIVSSMHRVMHSITQTIKLLISGAMATLSQTFNGENCVCCTCERKRFPWSDCVGCIYERKCLAGTDCVGCTYDQKQFHLYNCGFFRTTVCITIFAHSLVTHDLILPSVCTRRAYPRRFLGRVGRTPLS